MKNKTTLKKVLHLIKKYWFLVLLSLLLALASVGFTLYIPILTGNAVDYIIGPNAVDFEVVLKNMVMIAICAGLTAL